MKIERIFDQQYRGTNGEYNKIVVRYEGKIPKKIWDILPVFRWGTTLFENDEKKVNKKWLKKRIEKDTGYTVEKINYIEVANGYLIIEFIPGK